MSMQLSDANGGSRRALFGAASIVAALCACHVSHDPDITALPPGLPQWSRVSTEPALAPDLADAVAYYEATGEVARVAQYVDAHLDEDVGVWKEVVALRAYETIVSDGDWDSAHVRDVIGKYPHTFGADMLETHLDRTAFVIMSDPAAQDALVAFLDGEPAASLVGDGPAPVDPARFREQYEASLRDVLERRLLRHGCGEMMGYCNWWVDRYPDAPSTQRLQANMREVWHDRTYPAWRSGRHWRCAYRCGTTCRAQARPLEDSCYPPCYAKCP